MRHDIAVIGVNGYVETIFSLPTTEATINWLDENPKAKCLVDDLDRFAWEFEYLPDYPTEREYYE